MRPGISRGIAGIALACATLLAAAGCGNPPGTDGDLVNEWAAMADPLGWEPKAGSCHKDFVVTTYRSSYSPVECTAEHRYETVHLGTFTGDAAKLASPPSKGTADYKAAWADCDAKTTAFLGDDWRKGKIWIGISTPSGGAWSGGARWYRCEVTTLDEPWGEVTAISKSLKGELAKDPALGLGCYQIAPKEGDPYGVKACNIGHNSEFAGLFNLPEMPYDQLDAHIKANRDKYHKQCRSVIAGYVGVPDDKNMQYRTGTYLDFPEQAEWDSGDRAARCWLYLDKKMVNRSLKGTGNGGLPINYA